MALDSKRTLIIDFIIDVIAIASIAVTTHAYAQSTTPLPAPFTLPNFQNEFRTKQGPNYKIVYMDHVYHSAVTDVLTMMLSYRKENHPKQDPIIIINYVAKGYPVSDEQADFLSRTMPAIAKRSHKPIVFINAVALFKNSQGIPQSVYLAGAIAAIKHNKLGSDRTTLNFQGKHVLPYAQVFVAGEMIYDLTMQGIPETEVAKRQSQRIIVSHLLEAVDRGNALAAE